MIISQQTRNLLLTHDDVVHFEIYERQQLHGVVLHFVDNKVIYGGIHRPTVQVAGLELAIFVDEYAVLQWIVETFAVAGRIETIVPHALGRNKQRRIVDIRFADEDSALRCYAMANRTFEFNGKQFKVTVTAREYTPGKNWFHSPSVVLNQIRPKDPGAQDKARFHLRKCSNIKVNLNLPKAKPLDLIPFSDLPSDITCSIWYQLRSEEVKQQFSWSDTTEHLHEDYVPSAWKLLFQNVQPVAPRTIGNHAEGGSSKHQTSSKPLHTDKSQTPSVAKSSHIPPAHQSVSNAPVAGPTDKLQGDTGPPSSQNRPRISQHPVAGFGQPLEIFADKYLYPGGFVMYKEPSSLIVDKTRVADEFDKPYRWKSKLQFDELANIDYVDDTKKFLSTLEQFQWVEGDRPKGINSMLAQLPMTMLGKANILEQLGHLDQPFDQTVDSNATVEALKRRSDEIALKSNLTYKEKSMGLGKASWGVGYRPDEEELRGKPRIEKKVERSGQTGESSSVGQQLQPVDRKGKGKEVVAGHVDVEGEYNAVDIGRLALAEESEESDDEDEPDIVFR